MVDPNTFTAAEYEARSASIWERIDRMTTSLLQLLKEEKEWPPLTVGYWQLRAHRQVESLLAGSINYDLIGLLRKTADRELEGLGPVWDPAFDDSEIVVVCLRAALQVALIKRGALLQNGRFYFTVLEIKPGGPVLYRLGGETQWDDASWHALLMAIDTYSSKTASLRKQLAFQRRRADHFAKASQRR